MSHYIIMASQIQAEPEGGVFLGFGADFRHLDSLPIASLTSSLELAVRVHVPFGILFKAEQIRYTHFTPFRNSEDNTYPSSQTTRAKRIIV